MIKSIKNALPVVVAIMLTAGAFGLWMQSSHPAVLVGGLGTALIASLLFYAVIRWDEELDREEREKQQLADVVNLAMDAIVVCDVTGNILYANRSARDSYGLDDYPEATETIERVGLSGRQRADVFAEVLTGRPWNGELTTTDETNGGQVHLVSMFRMDAYQGHSPAIVSIARDLSERKELERKLLHGQKLAAVGELAAGVAHEINNPMAAIQSQIGLAKDLIVAESPSELDHGEILACIDQADDQVKRCNQIVNSLLHFSHGQAPQMTSVKIDDAIEQAMRFVGALSRANAVKLIHQPNGNLPPIKSDLNGICQILINLIVNAADACERRGEVRITARKASQDSIVVSVIDEGCGIEPKDLERVFEPFYTTKPQGQGTGLGLSISYGIAKSLGGQLSLRCPPEGGTCASLTLPIA